MRERDQSLDILRGIGISLMVFDHVGWGSLVHTYIQSFHMPLFFIVSGYLWRNEDMMEHFRIRFKTLMVPYACFSVCYLCLQMFPVFNGGNSFLASLKAILLFPTDIDNMPIAPALWFLPCMFLSTIAYSILSQLKWGLKALTIVVIVVVGMLYSSLSVIMLPFAIEPFTVALGFMLVGELIRRKQNNVMSSIDKSWVIIVLLVIEAVLAIVNKSVDLRSARYHNCILYTINSITGTLAYWGIARKIKLISTKIPWGGYNNYHFSVGMQWVLSA